MLPRFLRSLFSPADVAALVALVGVAAVPRDWPAQEPAHVTEPAATLVARVADAERAFADAAASQGVHDAFLAFIADSGVLLGPAGPVGRSQMAAAPAPPPSAPKGVLIWHPTWVEASRDGDLAVSTGPYESRSGADTVTRHGQFLTVWKRQPDGAYRYLMDGGIQHGAPAPGMPTVASARAGQPAPGALVATLGGPAARPARTAVASPESARAALLVADSAYAARAATDWAGAAATTYAADVRLMRNGRFPIVGRAAHDSIAAWRHSLPAQRTAIELSRDGELAVVRGTYALPAADGIPAERGHLVRVWRRVAGGKWEIGLEEMLAFQPPRVKR